ncbi:DsbA family protein [Bradyrhizobium prioriisuperbiae]|uniref:DsbA family protein n=1 Tax=Bradyrhizobium prioriisuperbiae TaxID=2854389 RepID=UPI0028E77F05|nr:DsbA family protein [Bradyrhizobium prioritasuperba]
MHIRIYALVAAACLSFAVIAGPAWAQQSAPAFNDDQRRAIGDIIKEYLIQNPEILQQANAELERRMQQAQKIAQGKALKEARETLLSSRGSIVMGNPDGKITMVEFSDYNCPYCRKALDDVQALIAANPQLKVIVKEFPVLGPESVEASQAVLAATRQLDNQAKRAQYHDGLMRLRGRVNGDTALSAAGKLGADASAMRRDMKTDDIAAMIKENMSLGDQLGITGTPTFIVGDQILVGAVGLEQMQKAVSTVTE